MRTPSGHVERHVTNLIVRRPFTRFYNLTTFDSCGGRRLSYGWLCGEVIVKVIRLGWASVKSTLRTSIFLRVCSIVFSILREVTNGRLPVRSCEESIIMNVQARCRRCRFGILKHHVPRSRVVNILSLSHSIFL